MVMNGLEADDATAYRNFGALEAQGNSPVYEQISLAIADDADVLTRLGSLPRPKRQPNLVLAAAKLLEAPLEGPNPWPAFRTWLLDHWDEVARVVLDRATQTNEVGRCAALLPFIGEAAQSAGGPIALAEVGCSAGLTLYPDLYSYRYTRPEKPDSHLGSGTPELTCELVGVDPPKALPTVGWRGGLDLNPLDLSDPEDAAWLQALVWPGQSERGARLEAATETVLRSGVRPHVVTGDLTRDVDALVESVPEGQHLVLFHTAVLAYVDDPGRRAFVDAVRRHGARPAGLTWIANEAPAIVPGAIAALRQRGIELPPAGFLISVNGEPRAMAQPHGRRLERLP